jgi:hypothetical protein
VSKYILLTVFTLLDQKNVIEDGDGGIIIEQSLPRQGLFFDYIRDGGDVVVSCLDRWDLP